jgi:hypothetical protein
MKGRCKVRKATKRIRVPGPGRDPDPRDSEPQEEPKGRPPVPSDPPAEDPYENASSDTRDEDETPPLGIRITTPTPRS